MGYCIIYTSKTGYNMIIHITYLPFIFVTEETCFLSSSFFSLTKKTIHFVVDPIVQFFY